MKLSRRELQKRFILVLKFLEMLHAKFRFSDMFNNLQRGWHNGLKECTQLQRNISLHMKKLDMAALSEMNVKVHTKSPEEDGKATDKAILLQKGYKFHLLKEGPPMRVSLNKDQATKYYERMQTIRRLENVAANLYREKVIRGFCHLYSGQEACAVGMRSAMRAQDNVITAYRCHGWCYLMGITTQAILAELTGRQSGCSRGKGGSMHMYAPHFYGGNGIVGAQVPLGAGIALASKYKGEGGVTLTLYGDGAANQGQVFESFNMAGLWKLPVIFVCENNQFGMGTNTVRASHNTNFYTRGDQIPGIWVDGMCVLAVHNATKFAIDYSLKHGPIILELNTYRYMGHSMSDPGTSYRSREEVQDVRQKNDPIMLFKELCQSNGVLAEQEFKSIDEKVHKEIESVVNIVKTDKETPLQELTADIYCNNLEPCVRGVCGYTLQHQKINKGVNH